MRWYLFGRGILAALQTVSTLAIMPVPEGSVEVPAGFRMDRHRSKQTKNANFKNFGGSEFAVHPRSKKGGAPLFFDRPPPLGLEHQQLAEKASAAYPRAIFRADDV
jgi:hypothetical protein